MKEAGKMLRIEEFGQVVPGAAKSIYGREDIKSFERAFLLKGVNLDQEGGVLTEEMEEVYLSPAKNTDRYMLKEGDVIVMARGSAIRVSLVDKAVAQKRVIASANFLIIRPDISKVQSEVLVAYLNSVVGQAALLALSTGAAIQHIPTSKLRSLQIPVPSQMQQNQITNIFHASKEAYKATLALAAQQKKTASASMLGLMMGAAL